MENKTKIQTFRIKFCFRIKFTESIKFQNSFCFLHKNVWTGNLLKCMLLLIFFGSNKFPVTIKANCIIWSIIYDSNFVVCVALATFNILTAF